MAYPTVDNKHTAEALALFTEHYRNKINITGIMKALTPSIQELEGVFWDIINKFQLVNNPTGDQLNALGRLVGAPRGSLNDADYLAAVRLQIRVNRSQGLSEDVIQVATLALAGNGLPQYLDMPIAQFLVECNNLPSPNVVAKQLSQCRSLGTRGVLHYTVWPDGTGNGDLGLSSEYAAAFGGLLDSRYGGAQGGTLVASAQL